MEEMSLLSPPTYLHTILSSQPTFLLSRSARYRQHFWLHSNNNGMGILGTGILPQGWMINAPSP